MGHQALHLGKDGFERPLGVATALDFCRQLVFHVVVDGTFCGFPDTQVPGPLLSFLDEAGSPPVVS